MNALSVSRLNTPAVKLFIKDLKELQPHEDSKAAYKWKLSKENITKNIGLIWIQGTISEVDEVLIVVEDGTGMCFVAGTADAPGTGDWIQTGRYCLVLGDLLTLSPQPTLKAIKVTHLTPPDLHRRMWDLEVRDLWSFFASQHHHSPDSSEDE